MQVSTLAAIALLAAGLGLGAAAAAQHATAFDIESGEQAYGSNCAQCHGPDGDLIAGIDLGRGLFRRPLSDAELVGIILNGIANTPMPPTPGMSEEQAERIVAWLRANAQSGEAQGLAGDASRGQALFAGQGACFDCHAVDGRGSRVGPDLSRIALLRGADELRASLIEPAAEVQPQNRRYTVVTNTGQTITGRLMNHDTFTIQLLDDNERLRSFDKTGLREHGFAATTMPSYAGTLSSQDIADLVSYMSTLQAP